MKTSEAIRGKVRTERTGPEVKLSILTLDGQELACCLLDVKTAEDIGRAMVYQATNVKAF